MHFNIHVNGRRIVMGRKSNHNENDGPTYN